MSYNFQPLKDELKKTEDWLRHELSGIRTGRAAPAVLDTVKVEAYGADSPITQVATVSVEDARMIRVTPWDVTLTKAIEKGIQTANLGLSVSVDDKGLRVIFPELTAERRTDFVKLAKVRLEEARVRLRNERDKIVKDIDRREKEGEFGEDEKFRYKNDLQKLIDDTNKVFDDLLAKKEKEITE